MRLIDVHTMELKEYTDMTKIPDYAILSHTWERDEVSYQEFSQGGSRSKAGYVKVSKCCEIARNEGYQHIWIDTCCIDKSSSSELSEAINSMFRWYESASICYAYLADVDLVAEPSESIIALAMRSKWFSRGWTLQELIAPGEVVFLDCTWQEIGTRSALANHIRNRTNIDTNILRRLPSQTTRPIQFQLEFFSVAERMSWAADRRTTRQEDEAYSLMGLFNVHLPLIYGEGSAAFQRLQQAIIDHTDDASLFSWQPDGLGVLPFTGLFASSTADFRHCHGIHTDFTSAPMRAGQNALAHIGLTPNVCESHKKLRICLPVLGPLSSLVENNPEVLNVLRYEVPGSQAASDNLPCLANLNIAKVGDAIIVVLPCLKKNHFLGLVLSKWPGANFSDVVHCRIHQPSLVFIGKDNFKLPAARNVYCYNPVLYQLHATREDHVSYKVEFAQLGNFGYSLQTEERQGSDLRTDHNPSEQIRAATTDTHISAVCGRGDQELVLTFQHPDPFQWPTFSVVVSNASFLMIGLQLCVHKGENKPLYLAPQDDVISHYVFTGCQQQFPLASGTYVAVKWRTHTFQLSRLIMCIYKSRTPNI